MSPEERDELIQFILQSQSNAAERHDEMMKDIEESRAELKEHTAELKEHTVQIQALASVSRDLLEVARLHARRLDLPDNLNP